ncbi:unnamed protein product [Ranitomeya imitator]|uniref:Uncharacterized protein n=1 Tax=Ranitomeya imitator TaxID=111125 RepID=A0ABN9LDM1_9NEOB|nr:unnamed protein product [Ranitomeya imitator]
MILRVGSRGRDKGEFSNLQGISTSGNNRIVVADSNNQCIQQDPLVRLGTEVYLSQENTY